MWLGVNGVNIFFRRVSFPTLVSVIILNYSLKASQGQSLFEVVIKEVTLVTAHLAT